MVLCRYRILWVHKSYFIPDRFQLTGSIMESECILIMYNGKMAAIQNECPQIKYIFHTKFYFSKHLNTSNSCVGICLNKWCSHLYFSCHKKGNKSLHFETTAMFHESHSNSTSIRCTQTTISTFRYFF